MQATEISHKRFVRRTALREGERRYNFRQIDQEAIQAVTSRRARKVTNLIGHIYLCLINAPYKFRQSEGELFFGGEIREGKMLTAWDQVIELLEVADGTALKALRWMHDEEVIGYYAGKNGVGIRIFINRAVSSIKHVVTEQKNLPEDRIAISAARVSQNAIPFKEDSRKIVDKKINTFAPQDGTDKPPIFNDAAETTYENCYVPQMDALQSKVWQEKSISANHMIPAKIANQIRNELKSEFGIIATRAAASEAAKEGELTRQWLERFGIPKAARVAQREAYKVFKHEHTKTQVNERALIDMQVGHNATDRPAPNAKKCSTSEISEIAETCITVFELQGKHIDETLAEINAATGGWLISTDIPKVREAVHKLMLEKGEAHNTNAHML